MGRAIVLVVGTDGGAGHGALDAVLEADVMPDRPGLGSGALGCDGPAPSATSWASSLEGAL